jgi:hypothetical protein
MKMKEIRTRYPGEWVLIEYTRLDEDLKVIEGEVIAHSPNRDEIYRRLLKTKGKDVAIEYLGEVPEDLAVMLTTHGVLSR